MIKGFTIAVFCVMAVTANADTVQLSLGLSLQQCKDLDSGFPSCVNTQEPMVDSNIRLQFDENQNVLVGTQRVEQKLNDYNIAGLVTVYQFVDASGTPIAKYRVAAEVLTWVNNDPTSVRQTKGAIEVTDIAHLPHFELEGDVHTEGSSYAAMPTLIVGPFGYRP